MKATSTWVFVGFFAVAAALPVLQPEAMPGNREIHRVQRSHYGPVPPIGSGYAMPAPGYYSPCAGASPHLPYQVSPPALHAGYGHALPYGLNTYGPHYRANEGFEDSDVLMDMQRAAEEQGALARAYNYEGPAAVHASGALAPIAPLASVASGPAVGVFPRGHVSGCNVPLLLSCSPSIVAGQLLHTKPHYGAYGGYGIGAGAGSLYRGADDAMIKEASGEELHQAMSQVVKDGLEETHGAQAAHSAQAGHATALQASNGASHNSNNVVAHQ